MGRKQADPGVGGGDCHQGRPSVPVGTCGCVHCFEGGVGHRGKCGSEGTAGPQSVRVGDVQLRTAFDGAVWPELPEPIHAGADDGQRCFVSSFFSGGGGMGLGCGGHWCLKRWHWRRLWGMGSCVWGRPLPSAACTAPPPPPRGARVKQWSGAETGPSIIGSRFNASIFPRDKPFSVRAGGSAWADDPLWLNKALVQGPPGLLFRNPAPLGR